MSEVNCPHCDCSHDTSDGPYGDGETQTWECYECEKEFSVTSHISIDYEVKCLKGQHDWLVTIHEKGLWADCKRCEEYAFELQKCEPLDDSVATAFEAFRKENL